MAKVTRKYLQQFDPFREGERIAESAEDYSARMRATLLPYWPDELLREWLHRHARHIDRYAFLRFERLRFARETWPLENIPGREAFLDPTFCNGFERIEARVRARHTHDWLAHFMMEHGTWNTPIVLLRVSGRMRGTKWVPLQRPLHLLEGHRRLSFLVGLKRLGRAQPQHELWMAEVVRDAA